ADLTAIVDDINIIMDVLMYNLAKINIDIDFDKLAESLQDMVDQLGGLDLSSLISITKTNNINKLVIDSGQAKSIIGIIYGLAIEGKNLESVVDTVINTIMPGADGKGFDYLTGKSFVFPTIFVEAGITDEVISSINLGIDYTGVTDAGDNAGKYAKLFIDLNTFSTTKTATIAKPEYVTKSLQLGVGAEMSQKAVSADLKFNVTGNMATTSSVLGNGTLTVRNGESEGIAKGFYNGQKAYFDLNNVFEALGGSAPTNGTVYSAKAEMYTAMHNKLVKWQASAKATPVAQQAAATSGESLSILQKIYEMLGGNVSALKVENEVRVDPTATEMLTAVKEKFGDYVRFEIKTTGYLDAFNEVKNAWTTNKEKVLSIIYEDKKWGDVADKEAWIGNLVLTKDGVDNDLLDIVNLFGCKGKTAGVPNDITIEFLAGKANKYLAILAISSSDNLGAEAQRYKAAIEKLDNILLIAKNTYLSDPDAEGAEAEFEAAKSAHNEALEFANGLDGIENTDDDEFTAVYYANLVMEELFGFVGTTDNYLAEFINSGVTVKITCNKGEGLNGGIEIWGKTNSQATKYVGINGYMKIVDIDDVGTDIVVENAKELTTYTETTDDDYRVIEKWSDGTKKIDLEGSTEEAIIYTYVEDEESNFVYDKKYGNLEGLQADIWDLLELYKAVAVVTGT
ncbi:MAG TPA: hypothetical protein VJ903_01925, partial [Clostridia bacterium]|nr:hypothetical protein [Clostridia bacterium]